MLKINYTAQFIRQLKKLPKDLQEEAIGKIEEFKNHKKLKVHKLQGVLADAFSFSANYSFRILFEYLDKNEVVLLKIGDHDIYK